MSTVGNKPKDVINISTVGDLTVTGILSISGLLALNYASDAAAAAGGVPIGGLYHNAGAVRVRLV